MVIYADTIETKLLEEGKGIETVVADGNVKIQQGFESPPGRRPSFITSTEELFSPVHQRSGREKIWFPERRSSSILIRTGSR